MARQDNQRSQRGLLLVEAILSAVVIGVGLVFVTRGLASHLKALRAVEEYDTLLSLAQTKLLELEAERQFRATSTPQSEGEFDTSQQTRPCPAPRWKVAAKQQEAEETKTAPSEITLRVWCGERPSTSITVSAVWPTELVPASWF